MTIGKRLKYGFGVMVALFALIFIVNIIATYTARNAQQKTAHLFSHQRSTAEIGFQMMQNRQFLGNYLLSGDTREADAMNKGVEALQKKLEASINEMDDSDQASVRAALTKLKDAEANWAQGFAEPLIEKRKQVDAGNQTVAELQIFYLQQNPGSWLKISKDPLDEAQNGIGTAVQTQKDSADFIGKLTTSISTLATIFAIALAAVIAFKTTQAITRPLNSLMTVAGEIGNSGDLDQRVDINSEDEIGQLAKTFNNMVAYHK
jgi:methyl-accepting chemotaxis protein